MNRRIGKFGMMALIGVALLVLAGLVGCGTDQSPMASQDEAQLVPAEGKSVLTFSTDAFQPAAKKGKKDKEDEEAEEDEEDEEAEEDEEDEEAEDDEKAEGEEKSAKKKIGKRGGSLKVDLRNERGGQDDIKVKFTVPKDALEENEEISMTVTGTTLSDLVIVFTPSGLIFREDARLDIKLGKDLVDLELDELVVAHTDVNGTVTLFGLVVKEDDEVEISIRVPGFSRYSLGGGE
ncbi:MAG: hypothetical protein HOC74_29315 [Gemmatimonadetes bacterium]|nr:hypothetical protein [Gemmatimonadota bacterium]